MRFILFILCSFFVSQAALAADVSVYTNADTVIAGDIVAVTIRLTSFERTNAVTGNVWFDANRFSVVSINHGQSVVTLWVSRPLERELGVVSFSGITPGGFQGADGDLFTIYLQAKQTGTTTISLHDMRVLAHDGLGSDLPVTLNPVTIRIREGVADTATFGDDQDTVPPEYFSPQIIESPDINDGKISLIFTAQDKGVGVDTYYIKEYRYLWQRPFVRWRYAESPYVLSDQTQQSYITVKAVDKNGNERVVVVLPAVLYGWLPQWFIIVGGVLLFISGAVVYRMLLRQRHN
jgi:hypothetical protein